MWYRLTLLCCSCRLQLAPCVIASFRSYACLLAATAHRPTGHSMTAAAADAESSADSDSCCLRAASAAGRWLLAAAAVRGARVRPYRLQAAADSGPSWLPLPGPCGALPRRADAAMRAARPDAAMLGRPARVRLALPLLRSSFRWPPSAVGALRLG